MNTILKEFFDIREFESKKMEGYISQNFRITSNDVKYVFKIYQIEPGDAELLHAENLVLDKLNELDGLNFPYPIANVNGENLTIKSQSGETKGYRLLSFVDGRFFSEIEHTEALFYSLGSFMAKLDKQLLTFRHTAIEARKIVWDLQYLLLNEKLIENITDPKDARIVNYFFLQYKENILPVLNDLRKSTLHNDANDLNLLTHNGQVTGIIDFGDMVYGPLIMELAIAITYAVMGKDDPLKWAVPIVKGYHEVLPLNEEEIDVLYYLVAARLCASVCNSAYHKKLSPESDYITVSERPAWDLLKKWITINPLLVSNHLKAEIGLSGKISEPVDQLIDKRHKFIGKNISLSYRSPIYMQRAAFQYMYDGYGNTYLDAYNNIPHVGHQHPDVVEVGQRQMARLNTNTRYLYDLLGQYAEKLVAKFPDPLNRVFFVNSGSAASDLAIRLALNYSQNDHIMVMEHGYHGNTRLGIEVSHYKYNNSGGSGQASAIIEAKLPDEYRLGHESHGDAPGPKMAKEALLEIENKKVAAFIAEPIVGCGGQVPLAKDYLKNIYPAIRAQGGICISDEVQVGFGRLGSHFWGYEMQQVIPDIVVLGKPMGNGHPIGAVVTSPEIAEAFNNGMEFFSSFGGNPVSCAIGMAVLDVIENEDLQSNANMVGEYFISQLKTLAEKYECIGDVRGSGLFLGVEIVRDRESKKQDTRLAALLKNGLKDRKILVSTDGPYDSVIKSKPPLCFSKDNVDEVIFAMESCIKETNQ